MCCVVLSGVISRLEAENYLLNMTLGSYLVRVSERVWGYTISYRAEDRCKHFLVDTSDQGYQFFGANQVVHRSLTDLVNFHKVSFSSSTVTHGWFTSSIYQRQYSVIIQVQFAFLEL